MYKSREEWTPGLGTVQGFVEASATLRQLSITLSLCFDACFVGLPSERLLYLSMTVVEGNTCSSGVLTICLPISGHPIRQ